MVLELLNSAQLQELDLTGQKGKRKKDKHTENLRLGGLGSSHSEAVYPGRSVCLLHKFNREGLLHTVESRKWGL